MFIDVIKNLYEQKDINQINREIQSLKQFKKNLTINLVTGNLHKVKEFKDFLEPEIKVCHLNYSYSELRSDDPREIAELAAQSVATKFNKEIIVEDSGIFISSLNDFPGTCSAYIHKRIGLNGILNLMDNQKNREAFYVSVIGYAKPNNKPRSFMGLERGFISNSIVGEKGFGHDPIFIPDYHHKTYGELGNTFKLFRKKAILNFLKFIIK